MTTKPRPRLLDSPDFQSFLDAIPESDPTTLQSLLVEKSDSDCNRVSQSVPGPSTEQVEHSDPGHNFHIEPTQSFHTVQPSTCTVVTVTPHQDTSHPRNGKRKLPSLRQMQNDDCILRLYGESTGRRHKRQKMKGRQCARCRLKNLKCSDGFPCTSCMEHWKRAANWATEKRMMAWSHCFDARLEDLNVISDLTHSIMFATTHPRKRSGDMKRHYLTGPFEQICFIRELVDRFDNTPSLRELPECQNSEILVAGKPQKSGPSAPPLSLLIQNIQKQLPSDPWTLTPTTHRILSHSDRPFIRLSEMVTIMFLHHDYILKHTSLGSYELYCLSLAISDMFFEQIARHFRAGKIHAVPIGSPQATELAIDLGTLFLLICHGPSHFQHTDLVNPIDAPRYTAADLADERANKILHSPDNLLATPEAKRYMLDGLDRFIASDSSKKTAQGRQLPFKAATLPNRWAFLRDYLSHWVDKVALCSAEPSTVTSRLVLAQKLCRLRLLDNDANFSTCARQEKPKSCMGADAPNSLDSLSTLCRQMQDHWSPQKALETLHGFLGDKRICSWLMLALHWLEHGPNRPERLSKSLDLIDFPDMFPLYIRFRMASVESLEFQLQSSGGTNTSAPAMDAVKQEWQAIAEEWSLTAHRKRELIEKDNRLRQVFLDTFVRTIWT